MKEHATLLDVLKTVAIVGGGASVLWGAGTWIYDMTELLATRDYVHEYHTEQNARIEESLGNIETSAVVTRIRGLLESKCEGLHLNGDWSDELQGILDDQLGTYFELTGRQFNQGTCVAGERVR